MYNPRYPLNYLERIRAVTCPHNQEWERQEDRAAVVVVVSSSTICTHITTYVYNSGNRTTSLSTWFASLSSISSYSEILQSTTTLSGGDKDQLPVQGIQYHRISCLNSLSPVTKTSTTITSFKARSNISSATCDSNSYSSTYSAAYKRSFWHLTCDSGVK